MELPVGVVHVWRANIDCSHSYVQGLERFLSSDELTRAHRFKFAQQRRHFIVARGLLRSILGLYLLMAPERIRLVYNASGKPFLQDEQIHFNLSHSGGIALYALVKGREVGIDIERARTDFNYENIVERFFSEPEKVAFRALPLNMRQTGFFNCWTRKEAFIKAAGGGISFALDQFEVSLAPGEPVHLRSIRGDIHAAAQWTLKELNIEKGYTAACAVQGPIYQIRYWEWND